MLYSASLALGLALSVNGLASTSREQQALYNLRSDRLDTVDFTRQPYISNGYIGQRIPGEGFGYQEFDKNVTGGSGGWPIFEARFTSAMIAGFYATGVKTIGDNFPEIFPGRENEPIATVPTFSSLYLTVDGATYQVGSAGVTNYRQSMSIHDGLVVTQLSWKGLNLTYSLFAHRTLPNLAVVRLDIAGLSPGSRATVTDLLDGTGTRRTTPVAAGRLANDFPNTIYSTVSPLGNVDNVIAVETSTLTGSVQFTLANSSTNCYRYNTTSPSTAAQCYSFTPANGAASFTKFVGVASSDAYRGNEFNAALTASTNGAKVGYEGLLASHRAAWDSIWNSSDILIPGNAELQLAARASMFHLLTNVRDGAEPTGLGDNSIAPAGLTSTSYAGQIFWDADTWMFSGLLALFTDYSKSITNFRKRQFAAAVRNAMEYNLPGALYPWTGARTGNSTSVGPSKDYEYHLNADIAFAQTELFYSELNQTLLETDVWPIVSTISNFFADYAELQADSKYHSRNATGPDEYAEFVDDSAFTNGALSVTLKTAVKLANRLGITPPSNWTLIANNMAIIVDNRSGITVQFDGFNGSAEVKQADVVLLSYPYAEFEQPDSRALLNLDYYAGKTAPAGPAMTFGIHSIVESSLSVAGCAAYTFALASSQPYSRAPFYQFSEQTNDDFSKNGGTNSAFTFLTAHGSFLQTLTHGFSGHRPREDAFFFDPSLPPQFTNYTLTGMKWQGSVYSLTLSTQFTTLIRLSGSTERAKIVVGPRNDKAGEYTLRVGESLIVPTGNNEGQTLIPQNLAECQRLVEFSNDTRFNDVDPALPADIAASIGRTAPPRPIVAGQYGLSAIDGSNATNWQPATPSAATIVIDLGSAQNMSRFHANWALAPPRSVEIRAGLSVANLTTLVTQNISISVPYGPATAQDIVIREGNVTNFVVTPLLARYVSLTIVGSYANDTAGATVSEFAVLR